MYLQGDLPKNEFIFVSDYTINSIVELQLITPGSNRITSVKTCRDERPPSPAAPESSPLSNHYRDAIISHGRKAFTKNLKDHRAQSKAQSNYHMVSVF